LENTFDLYLWIFFMFEIKTSFLHFFFINHRNISSQSNWEPPLLSDLSFDFLRKICEVNGPHSWITWTQETCCLNYHSRDVIRRNLLGRRGGADIKPSMRWLFQSLSGCLWLFGSCWNEESREKWIWQEHNENLFNSVICWYFFS